MKRTKMGSAGCPLSGGELLPGAGGVGAKIVKSLAGLGLALAAAAPSGALADIALYPAADTNNVGTAHTVCAQVIRVTGGVTNLVSGTTVTFNVTNGPNATVHATGVTDANGVTCFTYIGTGGVGTDIIDASFINSQGLKESTVATMLWVAGCNPVTVAIYSIYNLNGGGAPFSGLIGTFDASEASFATNSGYNWHPFGANAFGADITGILDVASAGTYSFSLNSDDGSLLFIDGNLVVNNGGQHPPTTVSGNAQLTAGKHSFEIQFFSNGIGTSGVDLGLPAGVTYGCLNNPPVALCTNVVVSASSSNCQANASINAGSYDPDAGDIITITQVPAGPYPLGSNNVCLIVTDNHGASNSCCAVVTVVDTTAPTLDCPDNITSANSPGQCSAVVNFVCTAFDACGGLNGTVQPPSGSVFPAGATTVTFTAWDGANNTNSCSFTVTVLDKEAPVVAWRAGVNPSGKNIPGKNSKGGKNPDGYYQLLASDNCDPNPSIYIHDTRSSFVCGPYHSGDIIKLKQSPGGKPSCVPGKNAITAQVRLKGDAKLVAVDSSGNASEPASCLVRPSAKK